MIKNKDRTCSTCEHKELKGYKEPCRSCCRINDHIFTNYTPKKRIKRYPAVSEEMLKKVNIYCDNDVRTTEALSTLSIDFPKIERVIFNGPATIVFWQDDTKTVVKCREGDTFDPEKGLAMAIAKKALGNENGYYEDIKKWMPKAFEKTCDNCKYTDLYYTAEPCFSCWTVACNGEGSKTKWEPKEDKPAVKWCNNCKHHDLSFISEPCRTCILDTMTTGRNTKWEPEENSVEKSCETCKYHNPTGHFRYGLACALCNEQEYWEPKE